MVSLKNYQKIVGPEVIQKICQKAKRFNKKHFVCVSSTHQGGGVAEMLNSLVFLFNELGIDFGWRIIHGSPDFFNVTKSIHNALQGGKTKISQRDKKNYQEINQRFSFFTHLNHDLVIIHDPQPLPLIDFYQKKQPWIFRCHIDLSRPNQEIWDYLKEYIQKYDHFVVSDKSYQKKLGIPQSVIHPAIDPLVEKNLFISEDLINEYLAKYGINMNKPLICQISRYDKWKDFEGVVQIFKKVKQKFDCQLVLLGNMAADDPEGVKIYEKLIAQHGEEKDITILANVDDNDFLVNALQRRARVIIQKSLKEGFALTVTEALYKGTPVVASKVGGIPLQVLNGYNGYLLEPKDIDGFVQKILQILENPESEKRLGQKGNEYVVKNFLITRLIDDWLDLFRKYL